MFCFVSMLVTDPKQSCNTGYIMSSRGDTTTTLHTMKHHELNWSKYKRAGSW